MPQYQAAIKGSSEDMDIYEKNYLKIFHKFANSQEKLKNLEKRIENGKNRD
jgi:hypothetical protein